MKHTSACFMVDATAEQDARIQAITVSGRIPQQLWVSMGPRSASGLLLGFQMASYEAAYKVALQLTLSRQHARRSAPVCCRRGSRSCTCTSVAVRGAAHAGRIARVPQCDVRHTWLTVLKLGQARLAANCETLTDLAELKCWRAAESLSQTSKVAACPAAVMRLKITYVMMHM